MQIGNYYIAHGHESKSFIRGGINAARQTAVNSGVNLIYQHLHRSQHAIVPFLRQNSRSTRRRLFV
jgi:hypothetical protein